MKQLDVKKKKVKKLSGFVKQEFKNKVLTKQNKGKNQ
jgi:hypothetical protein